MMALLANQLHLSLCIFIIASYFVNECQAGGDDDDKEAESITTNVRFWASIVGNVAIFVVIFIGGAAISLVSYCLLLCYERARKDKVGAIPEVKAAPTWSKQLVVQQQFVDRGFAVTSDGIDTVGLYRVTRTRRFNTFTDGARWDIGMTEGKHLFEIIWHWATRGRYATVGLATQRAPLKVKGIKSLVGGDRESWGLDIVRRRTLHGGRLFNTCPHDGSYVPDRFLMFVDLDSGTIGFGTDVSYWGDVITGLPTDGKRPLDVMVGADKWQSDIQVYYKGSADPNAPIQSDPDPTTTVSPYSFPPAPGPAYNTAQPGTSVVQVRPPDYTEKPSAPPQGHTDPPPDRVLYGDDPPPYSQSTALAPQGNDPLSNRVQLF